MDCIIGVKIMILMIVFVLIGFAFIGWSCYENMKSKKGTAQEFIKAEVSTK